MEYVTAPFATPSPFVVHRLVRCLFKKKCSERAENLYQYVFDHARYDGDARVEYCRLRPSRFAVCIPVRCAFKKKCFDRIGKDMFSTKPDTMYVF